MAAVAISYVFFPRWFSIKFHFLIFLHHVKWWLSVAHKFKSVRCINSSPEYFTFLSQESPTKSVEKRFIANVFAVNSIKMKKFFAASCWLSSCAFSLLSRSLKRVTLLKIERSSSPLGFLGGKTRISLSALLSWWVHTRHAKWLMLALFYVPRCNFSISEKISIFEGARRSLKISFVCFRIIRNLPSSYWHTHTVVVVVVDRECEFPLKL